MIRRSARGIAIAVVAHTAGAAAQPAPAAPAAPAAQPPAPPTTDGENLLARLGEGTADTAAPVAPQTFGEQLTLFGMETTWSGYGDVELETVPNQRTATFTGSRFNPIMSVHVSKTLSGELEIDLERGGTDLNIEYAMIDWTPLGSRKLIVRAGKFLTPIGRWNEELHPSFRWAQIDRPLMMTEVIPVEWSEIGVQVRGTLPGTVTIDYAAYVVNGLGIPATPPPASPEDSGYITGLRDNVVDNNFDKAIGGRIAATVGARETGLVAIGASGYSGKIDPDGAIRLSIADLDLVAKHGGLSIYAEAAQVFLGRRGDYLDRFERGAYLQLAYTIGRTTLAGRWDYARLGPELGPAFGPLVDQQQLVATIKYAPATTWSIRAEVAQPVQGDDSSNTKLSSMLSFAF